MSDPIMLDHVTPRFSLPLLYVGQTNKEVFVNEAMGRLDALLHLAIEAEAPFPPTTPVEGTTWLIAHPASGDWAGREGALATYSNGSWLFLTPREGMRVFDRSIGGERLFSGIWKKASLPTEPVGGTIVDGEARMAIQQLMASLQALGILPLM